MANELRKIAMEIFSGLGEMSIRQIGTSPTYVTVQNTKSWQKMHRKNLLKYLKYRGYPFDEQTLHYLDLALNASPEMTYSEFVDCYLEP